MIILTILNRTTGEVNHHIFREWDFNHRQWVHYQQTASYDYLRDYFATIIHPLCVRQMFYDNEALVGDGEDCLIIRAEDEAIGVFYERPRDEIDTYEWKRDSGLQ